MFGSPGSRSRIKRREQANSAYRQYWTKKYHSLSPQAYTYLSGSNQTWTVPTNRTWYAVNTWFALHGSNGPFFQRTVDIERPLELPGGTVLTTGAQSGFLYYFDPLALPAPADPEMAYYNRLARLKTIPLASLQATITNGAAGGTQSTANFPATFTNGMLRHISNNETAWVIFDTPSPMNTLEEISDNHQNRNTSTTMVPFARATFPTIRTAGGSISGDGVQTCLGGIGFMLYQVLPSDW